MKIKIQKKIITDFSKTLNVKTYLKDFPTKDEYGYYRAKVNGNGDILKEHITLYVERIYRNRDSLLNIFERNNRYFMKTFKRNILLKTFFHEIGHRKILLKRLKFLKTLEKSRKYESLKEENICDRYAILCVKRLTESVAK